MFQPLKCCLCGRSVLATYLTCEACWNRLEPREQKDLTRAMCGVAEAAFREHADRFEVALGTLQVIVDHIKKRMETPTWRTA